MTYDVTVSDGTMASLDGTVTLGFAGGQNIQDAASNALTNISSILTNADTYVLDNTAPTLLSIERQTPSGEVTNDDLITFEVTFSEPVSLDPASWILYTLGNDSDHSVRWHQ